ncbi:MAG: carboxypeptidase regulatory-like domain-containing protein [Planctomycetia bacterium]|nr:carboxypeptidase regulatory-like domain-containing protein [Planctomycetia bacterium]
MRILVLGPDEKPMPGAKIHAAIWARDPAKGNRDYTCDADGRIEVELPRQVRILRLWVNVPAHVGLFAQWWPDQQPADGAIPEEYTFRLTKGKRIGGTIKNEDGEPIEGAKVEVVLSHPAGAEARNRPYPNSWLATDADARITDASGHWSLDNAPDAADLDFRVRLTHPDYVCDSVWGKLQTNQNVSKQSFLDGTATIVMPRGIVLSGFVVDEDLKKVPGAVVVWGDIPASTSRSQETRTDENGRYRFPPLSAGPVDVTVIATGWAPEQQKIDLAEGHSHVHFQLKRGKTMRIRFVDRAGQPLSGVSVGIAEWHGGKALYNYEHAIVLGTQIPNQADENGVFEWRWAPADAVTYTFYHQKHQATKAVVPLVADNNEHEITLPVGGEKDR